MNSRCVFLKSVSDYTLVHTSMILSGVGLSNYYEPFQAGADAARQAISALGGKKPSIIIVFASVAFDQQKMLDGVRSCAEQTPIVGCSDAGEIIGDGPHQKSIAVMAIFSDQLQFTPGIGRDIKNNAREAGQIFARDIISRAPSPLKSLWMFPDVLAGNGADVVRGVLDIMGVHFPLAGGAPGDDFLFKETYQYFDGKVVSGSVTGVGLTGEFSMGIGVRHGWLPIGTAMQVTKSEGSVVHELDGKPAISIYENYFGARAEELRKEPLARIAITYPLGVRVENSDEYLIRDPIMVNEKGSITCAAEIPQGSEVRLMIGSKETAIEAARMAAEHAREGLGGANAKAIIVFNCIAREKLYGPKAIEEIHAIHGVFGEEVPLIGFYTYGEQAPLGGETKHLEKCDAKFYNETVVIFALGE